MNQHRRHVEPWHAADNRAGPTRGLAGYFSKRDINQWVPKRVPSLGWTRNLGHAAGVRWLMGSLVAPAIIVSLIWLVVEAVR